ncbi:hypothetical protein Pst134EA_030408 [Puccinia striiformis f. sp. tritici]|uniref:hypothetical protein n=1 Tax=Puccinia striiformis f. sp. tritici TaxID=168172 RepID=UPI00200802BA|nr:hypothetical protein Pst134EA_030408 [Puccinia striiformis f. sp. tritici]KAH9446491.1 hypothetical protein Pst134EA_030408 [Puccinia striiformis f. sp. tritici]
MENGAKIKDLLHQIKLLKQEISDGDADFTGVVMTQREIRELNTKKEILCFTQERIGIDNSFRRCVTSKDYMTEQASRALDAKSLVGSYVSSTGDHGKFVIVEGPLLWTMKEGKWLVCQDVDRASDVSFIKCSISLGKTSIVEALARLSGKKLQRINLSDQTDLLDLYGADASVEGASPGQFERKDASLLDAFQKGDWVLLDEMNLAPQTVLEGLNGCLDYRGTVYVPEIDCTFKRHPDCRVFAAQNPHGFKQTADVQVPHEGERLELAHIYREECAQTALPTQNPPSNSLKEVESPSGRVAQATSEPQPQNGNGHLQRDLTNLPRTEPPPRPPPTHLNTIPTGNGSNLNHPSSSTLTTSPALYGDSSKQPPGSEFRPALARNLTAVRIIEDQPALNELAVQDEPRLGSSTIATLSEPSALESVIVRHVATLILASESSAIKDDTSLDKLLEIIKARKGNFWGKLFKGGNNKTKIKKKGIFGISLGVSIERRGVDSLMGAGAGKLRVLSFVEDCILAMKQMDMSVEGLFRKNGNIRCLKELTDAIDRDDSDVNLSDDNAVQLAALFKKFLRDLSDPLLTFKSYHLFIAPQRKSVMFSTGSSKVFSLFDQ